MRKVGPINPAEVKSFQRRYPDMTIDGKVGNQTWGEVLRIESAWHICKARKPVQPDAGGMFVVGAGIGALLVIALQVMFLA